MIYPKRRTRKGKLLARNGRQIHVRQMGKYNGYVCRKYGEDWWMEHVLRVDLTGIVEEFKAWEASHYGKE